MSRRKTTAYVSALLATLLTLGPSAPASADEVDDFVDNRISGIIQLDVTNAYFFRGILQEKHGVQLEPWSELYLNLYSADDGFLRDVTVGGGLWLSFQSEMTGATEGPAWLYEGDYYPILSLGFAGGLTLNTTYYWYSSPNGAFPTEQALDMKLSWDDSEAFGRWSMQPWVNYELEIHNTAFGPDSGQGLQFGIGPTLYAAEDESFTLTAPCEVGLAIHDYYENAGGHENMFGYGAVGLLASIPLKFMPKGSGDWTFGLGVKYYAFSETLENVNSGKSTYPVGTASLSVAF